MAFNPSAWNPPLPPGWEARYDHNQKAYFYIHHSTRSTTWVDPRTTMPQQAAASLGATGGQYSGQYGRNTGYAALPLQDMTSCSPSHSTTRNEESSMSTPENPLVKKLKTEYPGVSEALLGDLLRACFDSEREVREQLKDLGFTVLPQSGGKKKKATPKPKREASPKPAPAKREPSENEKKRATDQMKRDFPEMDPDVIRIALDTCNYDITEGKQLIQAYSKNLTESSSRPSTSSGAVTSTTSVSTVPSYSTEPASLEPAGLGDGDGQTPKGLSERSSTSPARQGQGRSQPSAQPQHSRARHVTKVTVSSRQKPKPRSGPATSPSVPPPVYVQSVSQRAKGPDSSLKKGPDESLLTSEYTLANGPDQSLRRGPDRSLLSDNYTAARGSDHSLFAGAVGGLGPDPALHCGAQSSLRGAMTESGDMTAGILVTNI